MRVNKWSWFCGCLECRVCKGTRKEIIDERDPVQTKCSTCNGTGKLKMCKAHAIEVGWIKENK